MKMYKFCTALLIFVILLNSNAFAAKWFESIQSTDGDIYYLDVDSIAWDREDNNNIYIWVKHLRKNIKKLPSVDLYIKKQKVAYSLEYYNIHCRYDELRSLQFAHYGAQHQLLESSSHEYARFSRTIPETIGESIYKDACIFAAIKQNPSAE